MDDLLGQINQETAMQAGLAAVVIWIVSDKLIVPIVKQALPGSKGRGSQEPEWKPAMDEQKRSIQRHSDVIKELRLTQVRHESRLNTGSEELSSLKTDIEWLKSGIGRIETNLGKLADSLK